MYDQLVKSLAFLKSVIIVVVMCCDLVAAGVSAQGFLAGV